MQNIKDFDCMKMYCIYWNLLPYLSQVSMSHCLIFCHCKHGKDLKHCNEAVETDLLLLTETHLQPGSSCDCESLKFNLKKFHLTVSEILLIARRAINRRLISVGLKCAIAPLNFTPRCDCMFSTDTPRIAQWKLAKNMRLWCSKCFIFQVVLGK